MHWGKHDGKTLDVILQEDPTYFEYFVGQRVNILDIYPELRIALNARNGYADALEKRRPELMKEEAEKLLQTTTQTERALTRSTPRCRN